MNPNDPIVTIAFAAWYLTCWDNDAYDHDKADIAKMWEKFKKEWLPSLGEEHCGDCTKVCAPCTRCHTEAYVKYASIIQEVTTSS